jgi:hypothetical protein
MPVLLRRIGHAHVTASGSTAIPTEMPLSAWTAFFQAELGAAAALAGLLFVGILLSFLGAGASAWVLLIEINR